jgi:NADH dehydrogenase
MVMRSVAVFGGTGFLGRAVVNQLVAAGMKVRVAVRHPEPVNLSDGTARAEHVRSVYADVADEKSVGRALEGCDAAVNVVGLYVERGTDTFRTVHELGAMHVARQSARAGVKSLVHMSGIGANLNSQSSYVRSRARGELLVREAFPAATMLRPSVQFGPDDKFLNTLITIVRRSPVLALFGAGNTRLQPVYVGDVAKAVLRVLTAPSSQGKVYELGGPQIYRYRDLIKLVLKEADRSRILVPLPFFIWDTLARLLMLLPDPPLTTDVVTLMRQDNVVGAGVPTFADLGLAPTSVKVVLPVMLGSRTVQQGP